MTEHAQFTVERRYAVPRATLFRAWSDPTLKRAWYVDHDLPDWTVLDYALDFREGGIEHGRVRDAEGRVFTNLAFLHDISDGARIVMSTAMSVDDTRQSVSLATATFADEDSGCLLRYTEQAVVLAGEFETRKAGWEWLLETLAAKTEAMA